MADLAPTAASVVKGAGAQTLAGPDPIAGEAITAGQPFYIKASDSKAYKCDANTATSGVPEAVWAGIALNSAAAGQPVVGQTGGQINLSCTTVVGACYVLSAAAGMICPLADIVAGTPPQNITVVGFGVNTSGMVLLHNFATGISLAA